jgi:hypothetical protein
VTAIARHGETTGVTDPELLLGDDPDLANVFADLAAWQLAHPCDCEALCECDDQRSGS